MLPKLVCTCDVRRGWLQLWNTSLTSLQVCNSFCKVLILFYMCGRRP